GAHVVRAIKQIASRLDAFNDAFGIALGPDKHVVADGGAGFLPAWKALARGAAGQLYRVVAAMGGDDAPRNKGRVRRHAAVSESAGRRADGCRRRPNAPDRASAWRRCRRTA